MKVTDEMRDNILLKVSVMGLSQSDAARELGCSVSVVSRVMNVFRLVKEQRFDELRDWAESVNASAGSLEWAAKRTRTELPAGYVENIRELQSARKIELQYARKLASQKKPEPAPKPKPEPVHAPETAPTGPKTFIPAPSAELGWQTRIKVQPDKVCMMVYFNGMEVVQGWSKVKGDKELDLMQAISYAAHMCYKIVEQKKLGGR